MPTATDLFAGAGGSSEGLRQAGYDVLLAVDCDATALATHALNHERSEHRLVDLTRETFDDYPRTDLLWASPSCRWHAKARSRKRVCADVERQRADDGSIDRAMAFAIVEAARVCRYPTILVENVVDFAAWSLLPEWIYSLHDLGYRTSEYILDAAWFGHAQWRERWFCIATLGAEPILPALGLDEPACAASVLDDDPGQPMTRRLYVSDQVDEIELSDVPHLVMYRRHAHPLRADRHPLATVTAGGNHHAIATLIDGVPHHRMVRNRECARAQGFPDSYRFVGNQTQVKRQIGNAVAVGVARWLGQLVAA